jgi:hypothetical protein
MKVHPVNLLVALVISGLLTYGIVSVNGLPYPGLIGVGAFVTLASTLVTAIGLQFENPRAGVNVRLVSLLFFAGLLLFHAAAAFLTPSQTVYVIVTGIAFMVYVLIANAVHSARQ